jgi:leucyl/phenylalanyl-tRNA--protein transferase
LITWLEPGRPFPPLSAALDEPPGLLAAGGDLSPGRLIEAYRQGIFPWFSDGQPVLWWSTDPRMVLFTDEFRVSHSLRKRLAKMRLPGTSDWEIRVDSAFETVMRACGEPRPGQDGTWITEGMLLAYAQLHQLGIAHSVETWVEGRLVGGLYGLAIGRMFYGESMFTRIPDASKVALAHLVSYLKQQQFPMIDCQQQTSHLASLGARPIPRGLFADRLRALVDLPGIKEWPSRIFA